MLWRVGSNMRARLMENMSVMDLFSAVVSLHIELPKPLEAVMEPQCCPS
jgi:hypothetical protein